MLDEVHKSLSKKRSEAVSKFTKSIKLGFTATPKFSADKNVKQLLNSEIHSMSIKETVEADLLSSFSVIVAQSDIDLTQVPVTSTGDYQEEELQKAVDVYNRNQGAVDLYKKMFDGKTAVAYCVGIKHSEKMAQLFREAGVPAGFISGKNTEKEQRELLRKFKTGEIKILCNADILIEGFDEPRASVCLNLRPTLSLIVAEQRGGRVLRKDPKDSKKHAYIVDFFDKTENGRNIPVSFAQIAEGVNIIAGTGSGGNGGGGGGDIIYPPTKEEIITIPGLKVITNAEEVLRVIREMESKKYQLAPEGWMHRFDMRQVFGKRKPMLEIINRYRKSNPEWYGYYLNDKGQLLEFFSPELANLIKLNTPSAEKSPEGWMNAYQIRKAFGNKPERVKKFVDQYRKSHPEWIGEYLDKAATNITEFYSPDLIEILKKRRYMPEQNTNRAPEGWISLNGFSTKFHKNFYSIKKVVQLFRESHPEWFHRYVDGSGYHSAEFYSPELVNILTEKLIVKAEHPKDWMNNGELSVILKKHHLTIKKSAGKYRDSHPEWFANYPSKKGPVGEFYSPELVEQIKKDLGIT